MAIKIIRDDITKVKADAIVDSINRDLVARGKGISGSIHAAAGPELEEELLRKGRCELGEAVITGSYRIKTCRYIIHTVAPGFYNWERNEKELLRSCYKNIFRLAEEYDCESIAMPVLSAGRHGIPDKDAFDILLSCARDYAHFHRKTKIIIVLFSDRMVKTVTEAGLKIDEENITEKYRRLNRKLIRDYYENGPDDTIKLTSVMPEKPKDDSLEPEYRRQDLNFSEMCRWWMKEKEILPTDFYYHSHLLKSTFSNISKEGSQIVPKKTTAFLCCIGLRLDLDESTDLMKRAGYTFSDYYDLDQVMVYLILKGERSLKKIRQKILDETGVELWKE